MPVVGGTHHDLIEAVRLDLEREVPEAGIVANFLPGNHAESFAFPGKLFKHRLRSSTLINKALPACMSVAVNRPRAAAVSFPPPWREGPGLK
jgi:hypothetical protein